MASNHYGVPGLGEGDSAKVADILQDRLYALNDLHLTLKHVHWNVVGPHFIAVHEMLDPQVDTVREYADQVAERIATLGGSPKGTPGALVENRSWNEYSIGRAGAIEHLGALDLVYSGVIASHREAIEATGDVDPITEDLLIGQSGQLEQYHWFVRAHLENAGGELSTSGAETEREATVLAEAGVEETV
ncbi:Dps family protein [Quadrisphaera sp. KR29]|uniref:Dps family protein n=1 Tax=Quadrisphaera sp. KR29 TaxID=3461391 RepID=UPI0040444534